MTARRDEPGEVMPAEQIKKAGPIVKEWQAKREK